MGRSTVHYADNKTNNALKKLHNKLRPAGTPVQRGSRAPFPLFPISLFPAIALSIAVIAMSIYNLTLMGIFWGIMGFGYVSFRWYQREG